jgi:hypothetical protein
LVPITNRVRVPARLRWSHPAGAWSRHPGDEHVISGGRLVLDPDTAPVVRRIFAEVLAGRSVLAIVRGLNADGIPPPGGGAEWQQWAAWRVLSNPVHVGWLRRGSGSAVTLNDAGDPVVVVEGPTTVSVEDWERARAVDLHRQQRPEHPDRHGVDPGREHPRRCPRGEPAHRVLGHRKVR